MLHAVLIVRAAIVAVLGWLILSTAVLAQPTTDRVLSGADVREQVGCTFIRVEFNFPVQYISHFPPAAGDELRIQINPIVVNPSDREALLLREAVSPPGDADLGILAIVYDGELSSGPVLTMIFRRPLSYDVGQGRDFRSIVIGVPGPDRAEPCVSAD
jgi:hypothetical protein